jgi:plastocyanin
VRAARASARARPGFRYACTRSGSARRRAGSRPILELLPVLALLPVLLSCGEGRQEVVPTTRVEMPPSYRFEPPAIAVVAGDTVTFVNRDHFTHSVRFESGGLPYLELAPGDSARVAFERPATYDYVCTYHPHDMRGRVVVSPGRGGPG